MLPFLLSLPLASEYDLKLDDKISKDYNYKNNVSFISSKGRYQMRSIKRGTLSTTIEVLSCCHNHF